MTLQVIEVAIGLSFVYLLFSLVASAVNEFIAGLLGLRQGTLRRGIARLLSDNPAIGTQLQKAIYGSSLIKGLCHGTGQRKDPSYIDKDIFASVLIGALNDNGVLVTAAGQKRADTGASPWAGAADAVAKLATDQSVEQLRGAAAKWFDAAMDRVSGAYKRLSQAILLVLAVVMVVGFDVDTIAVVRTLWTNPQVRATTAERASAYAAPDLKAPGEAVAQIKAANQRYSQSVRDLNALDVPLGWPDAFWSKRPNETDVGKVFGLLLSAIAISLGAPFWFDVLSKVSNLRAAGRTPADKEAKKGK